MQRGTRLETRNSPPGLVATASASMSAFLVQPLPIVVPLVVDLLLWGAPRLSPARLLDPVRTAGAQTGDPAMLTMLEELSTGGSLVMILGFLVPSLLVTVDRSQLFAAWTVPMIDPGGVLASLAWVAMLFVPAAVLAMTFRVGLGRVVRDVPLAGDRPLRAIALAALRYLAYLALVGVVLFGLAFGAGIAFMVFAIVGINVLPLLSTLLVLLVLIGGLALAFVPDAMALLGVGPVRAILISLDIVRRFPWSALGLIFGINVVSLFAAVLLGPMVTTAIGLALAILGFAVIATVLGLARMSFLNDRLPLAAAA